MSDLPELKYLDEAARAAGFEFGWETGFHPNSPIAWSMIAHAKSLQKLAELEAENARHQADDATVERAAKAYAEATGYYTQFHRGLSSPSADKIRVGIKAAITAMKDEK